MIKNGFLICIYFLVSLCSFAEPQIVFDKKQVDLGVVYNGSKAEYDFCFKNAGDKKLIIDDNIVANCSCTKAILSATTFIPFSTGTIKVKLNTNSIGEKEGIIILKTNDYMNKDIKLFIKGNIKNYWITKPSNLVKFTDIHYDKPHNIHLSIENIENEMFEITDVIVNNEKLKVNILSNGEKSNLIDFIISPNMQKLKLYENVKIVTNSSKQRIVNIPVIANSVGLIKLSKNLLFFGIINNEEEKEDQIELKNLEKERKMLKILHYSSKPDVVIIDKTEVVNSLETSPIRI
jgi:hypothetical protein